MNNENIQLSIEDLPGFIIGHVPNSDEEVTITLSKKELFYLVKALVYDMYIVNSNTVGSKLALQRIVKDLSGVNLNIESAYDRAIKERREKKSKPKKENALQRWFRIHCLGVKRENENAM